MDLLLYTEHGYYVNNLMDESWNNPENTVNPVFSNGNDVIWCPELFSAVGEGVETHQKQAALEGVFRHLPLVVYRCVNLGLRLNICNHNIYNMLIC